MELVYELKERIYHNQYKVYYPAITPSYYQDDYGTNFPLFEYANNVSVKDLYTNKTLDLYFEVDDQWAHVSRDADIQSIPTSIPQNLSNYRVCPATSRRNLGRKGLFINHVFEYGSFYNRLVPDSIQNWSKKKLTPKLLSKAEVHFGEGL